MIVILSTSEPTVSATFGAFFWPRCLCNQLANLFVNALNHVIALLVEAVDGALGRRDLAIVRRARFVLLVPELDVGHRETGNQLSKVLRHGTNLITTPYHRSHGDYKTGVAPV